MIIGICSASGVGKTTASKIFEQHGFYHIDCDKVVRQNVYNKLDVIKAVESKFPSAVNNNKIDRKKLGEIVFNDNEKLLILNKTVLPFISQTIREEIKKIKGDIILDAPTLFEAGLDEDCDIIIGILSSEENKIKRLILRDNIDISIIKSRLKSQKSDDFYKNHCDIIIENNKSVKEFIQKVKKVINEIKNS